MNEQELRWYYELYTGCWKLFKKYSNPEDSDDFWQALHSDWKALGEQMDKTLPADGHKDFKSNMLILLYLELEAIQQGKRAKQ